MPAPFTVARDGNMLVGLGRLELPTSRLSSARSNRLSYKPRPEGGPRREKASLVRHPWTDLRRPLKKGKRRRRRPAEWVRDNGPVIQVVPEEGWTEVQRSVEGDP